MANTKTLSVRVPIDVANNIENLCKQRGISRNAMLQECIASEGIVGVNHFTKGGVVPMPEEIVAMLTVVGGVATGTLVYHLLNNNLPIEWSEDKRKAVSTLCAIAGGLGMLFALEKVTHTGINNSK
jgi:hypothetical protein